MAVMRYGGFWAALAVLCAPAVTLAQQPHPMVYAYPDQSVWTARQDLEGNPANPLLGVAQALFAKAHLPWRTAALPAARMFAALQDGSANFSFLVNTPRLHECCLLSHQPIARTWTNVYHRKGLAPITEPAHLSGHTVIIIRGYSYGGLRPFLHDPTHGPALEVADSHASAFDMLRNGRADYLLDYAGPAAEILAVNPIADLVVDKLEQLDVYIVLHKSYPDAQASLERLERIAETLDIPALMALPPR